MSNFQVSRFFVFQIIMNIILVVAYIAKSSFLVFQFYRQGSLFINGLLLRAVLFIALLSLKQISFPNKPFFEQPHFVI